MKRLFKRLLAITLCLSMVMVLSACGSGGGEGNGEEGIAYPEGTIEIVVPFAAGGGMDLLSRAVQQYFDIDGFGITITNMEGGNSSIGSMEVFNSEPDGYKILCSAIETIMGYNMGGVLESPVEEYVQLGTLVYDPHVISVNKSSQFKSIEEVIAYAKENPGKLNWGGTGSKGNNEMASAEFWQAAGIEVNFVPFDSGSKTTTAGMGGHTDITFCQISEIKTLADAGDMVPLAVFSAERSAYFPETPACKELGYDIDNGLHRGFFAPPGTPQEIADKLEAELKEVYESEEWQELVLDNVGFEPSYLSADDAKQVIEKRYPIQENLLKLIKAE